MKLLTFNINADVCGEESYIRNSFPEWKVESRIPLLIKWLAKIIEEHSPDIIHLQEAVNFITKFGDDVDSVTPVVNFLSTTGYIVKTAKYNPSDKSFYYITAIKLNKYNVVDTLSLYLTKTPEKSTDHSLSLDEVKDNNFDQEWERSIFITKFTTKPKKVKRENILTDIPQSLLDFINGTVNVVDKVNYINDIKQYEKETLQTFYSINVHLGMNEKHRLEACKLLKKWITEIIQVDPKSKIVVSGDFNTFPDKKGPEQIEILKSCDHLYHSSDKLYLINSEEKIDWSFIAFPYDFADNSERLNKKEYLQTLDAETRRKETLDIFAKECNATCGQLDHIFLYNFIGSGNYLIPATLNNELTEFTEESIKKYILDTPTPAFVSDHQPILTIL
jgi:exonuclease III